MDNSGVAADPELQERRLAASLTARYSDWVVEALDELQGSFLLTDPAMPGHPIVYASRGLASLTGYLRREVLGRNARVFQGAATDRAAVAGVREAVRGQCAHQIAILNYRRDASPHWVLLHSRPFSTPPTGGCSTSSPSMCPSPPCSAGPLAGPGAPRCSRRAARRPGWRGNSLARATQGRCFWIWIRELAVAGLEAEEPRVASDSGKEKALSTANSIFSALNRYRKLTGLVLCGKRCDSVGIPALSSSLNLSLSLSLGRIKQSFVLTDPHLPEMPIIYASDAFLSLTGYSREEILGCNCRFLNGLGTSVEVLEEACTVHLLNYRKDGSSFCDLLHVSPIRNASGKVAFHVWVHLDESAKYDFNGLTPEVWQLGAVGAVRVAVRSLPASGTQVAG